MPRDVGDRQNIQHLVYDPFADPPALMDATVVCAVTDPTGAITTPSVTHAATGVYQASFSLTIVGVWYWHWAVTGAVIDAADGQVTVENPGPPPYATLEQLKQQRNTATTDRDDDLLQNLLTASRRIDRMTGDRQFWLDKTVSARTFRLVGNVYCDAYGEWLIVDDIGNITGLIVEVGDGTTFSAITDYQTGPDNAIVKRQPINRLLRPLSYWSQGAGYSTTQVRVTARWGWPAIPDEVSRAAMILANKYFLRKDSPEGVLGNSEWGPTRVGKMDPDVEGLIGDLCLAGMA